MFQFLQNFKTRLDNVTFDFVAWRNQAAAFSTALVVLSWAAFGLVGANWGIDFTGGTEVQLAFEQPIEIAELRTDLGTACANLTRIETLCGVRGIDPTSAIPVIPTANSTPDPVAEYRAACEAKDWKRANEIYKDNKAAIWAARVV